MDGTNPPDLQPVTAVEFTDTATTDMFANYIDYELKGNL